MQFNDSSLYAGNVTWDFGDGENSSDRNPVHTFSVVGNYTINLTAINMNGTNSTYCTIHVIQGPILPIANFSSNVTNGTAPLDVQFNDSSLNVTAWNWNFGDGSTSIQQNPTHTYTAAGIYTVNLTASNANGTNSSSGIINVIQGPVLPIADFSINVTRGFSPLTVQFTDNSENANEWNWNFGDGNYSIDRNPTHTYYNLGENTVNLTVHNSNGTSTKISLVITTKVVGVSLSFDPKTPFWPGENVSVTAGVYPALPGAYVQLESEINGWFAEGYTDNSGNFTGYLIVPDKALEKVMYTSKLGGFYISALANGINSIDYFCNVSEKPVSPVDPIHNSPYDISKEGIVDSVILI